MTSRAQKPLVRIRSHSENSTFLALLREQSKTKKRASNKKNIAERIPETTRRRKLNILTDIIHNLNNYTTHSGKTGATS